MGKRGGDGARGRAALALAVSVGLSGCAPFFYSAVPSQVTATNHSADPVEVLLATSPEVDRYTVLEPGQSADLAWPSCTQGWVVVRYAGGELFREELRICPDDVVDVTLSREVVVECGRYSARERGC